MVWAKPKEFQYQKLARDFWGSPYFILLKQLPIPEDILIRSRFLQYYVTSIPIHLLFLIMLFLSSASIKSLLSPGEYISFSLIWISSGIGIGSVFPASDSGDIFFTQKISDVFQLSSLTIFIGGFSLFIYLQERASSIGRSSPQIAGQSYQPIFPLLVRCLCLIYWPRYMKKNIERIDYYK